MFVPLDNRLNGTMVDEEVKQIVKDMLFSSDQVDDVYFQDYWKETAGKKDDIQDLTDGSRTMSDSLKKLTDNNSKLKNGIAEIFAAAMIRRIVV